MDALHRFKVKPTVLVMKVFQAINLKQSNSKKVKYYIITNFILT